MATVRSVRVGNGALRFAPYTRVSTGRQEDKQLSLPDQGFQLREHVERQGGVVVEEFSDTKSGTNGNRPGLQRLLALVESGQADFDFVVVHSYSRFFRNLREAANFLETLREHGIEIISITQPVPPGPAGDMMRYFFMIFDEYQSAETGKHVERSMRENARQGYWSGGRPPYGYASEAAGTRGNTIKKKLAVEPYEAANVRLIFDLYLKGDGASGPLGVKRVTGWLNDHGSRTRGGARWGIGAIHRILTDKTLTGTFMYGRTSKDADTVPVDAPIIIPATIFDAAQRSLRERDPKKTPPRVVTGPILLSGLATCGSCGAAMTTRTGKSGQYRYYTCGSKIRIGVDSCRSESVPMEDLDRLITDHVVQELLTPNRMRSLLEGLLKRQLARDGQRTENLGKMREKLENAEQRLSRIYEAIEDGTIDRTEPTLKKRIDGVKTERDLAQTAIDRATAELLPSARITEKKIAAFIQLMRTNITNGTIEFRRSYLRALLKEVQLHQKGIRIIGKTEGPATKAA